MTQGGRDKILTISKKLNLRGHQIIQLLETVAKLETTTSWMEDLNLVEKVKNDIPILDEIVRSPLGEDIDRDKLKSCILGFRNAMHLQKSDLLGDLGGLKDQNFI